MSYYTKTKKIIVIFVIVFFPMRAQAASLKKAVDQGNALYAKEDYAASEKKYIEALKKDTESDIINFNLGAALYKNKAYDKAIKHFRKALLTDDEPLKKRAYYNLGNALYKSGSVKEKNDIQAAIGDMEKSLIQYQNVLDLDAEDEDAKYNYDFVKKEIKRLKEKAQQQQDQQQKDQKSGKQKEEEKKKKSQGQQQNQQQKNQKSEKQKEGEEKQKSQGQQQQNQQGQQDNQKSEQGQQQEQKGHKGEEQQDQSAQQERGEKQENEEQISQQKAQEGQKGEKPQKASAQQMMEAGAVTKEEAKKLLENYKQTEEPQGLLNVFKERGQWRPVEKDW